MVDLIRPDGCKNCAFHVVIPQGARAQPQMFCRRNPPVAALAMIPTPQGVQTSWQSAFPPVQPNWMCGEFKQGVRQPNGEMAVPVIADAQRAN